MVQTLRYKRYKVRESDTQYVIDGTKYVTDDTNSYVRNVTKYARGDTQCVMVQNT